MTDLTGEARGAETGTPDRAAAGPTSGTVTVRYWAAARSAAGTETDELSVEGPVTLAEVTGRAAALHPEGRLPQVLGICSVLIGDRPAGGADPDTVTVNPGDRVEYLPPFAGG
jgi:molybdopterin converting factor small subunit